MLVDQWGSPVQSAPARSGVARLDSWVNEQTGVGGFGDKTTYGRFSVVRRVTDTELVNLFNGSPLAAKVCEKEAVEMFRRGYDLECTDVDASACKDLCDYAREDLHVDEQFLEAEKWGNVFGADLLVNGIDDGGMPDEPLDESRIKSFTFLNNIDRRFAFALAYYTEPGPKCGMPSHYLTSNAIASYQYGSGRNARTVTRDPRALERSNFFTAVVHESRCTLFEGISTDIVTRQTLAGWSWSVLQRVYDSLRKFEHAFDSARYLLSDASQAVMTLKGLIDAISAGKLGAIQTRMELMERTRSVIHGVLLDEGETYTRQGTPMTGISDILDKMMAVFAADVGYPFTELFGRAASGLNAAAGADSETRKWYDSIASKQKTRLGPKYVAFYRRLALSADCPVKLPAKGKDGKPLRWKIKFKPLYTPSDSEQADTDLKIAQRNQIYLAEEVISPEECALDVQDLYPSMDVEAREEAIEAAQSFDPHAEDPEPEVPPPPPGGVVPGGGADPNAPPATAGAPPAAPAAKAVPPGKKTAAAPAKKPAKATAKGGT